MKLSPSMFSWIKNKAWFYPYPPPGPFFCSLSHVEFEIIISLEQWPVFLPIILLSAIHLTKYSTYGSTLKQTAKESNKICRENITHI